MFHNSFARRAVRAFTPAAALVAAGWTIGCAPQSPPAGEMGSDEKTVAEADPSAEVNRKLDEVVPKVEFPGIGLGDVIQYFRDAATLSIHPKWEALKAANIDERTPVNVRLTKVTLGKALRTVLDDVGGVNPLEYVVDEGVITISTKDDLSLRTTTRVYDVSDLIARQEMTRVEKQELRLMLRQALHEPLAKTSAKGKPEVPGESLAELYRDRVDELAVVTYWAYRVRRVEELAHVIRQVVAPETWRDVGNGGTIGCVQVLGQRLIITQTPANHRWVVALLAELRKPTGAGR